MHIELLIITMEIILLSVKYEFFERRKIVLETSISNVKLLIEIVIVILTNLSCITEHLKINE